MDAKIVEQIIAAAGITYDEAATLMRITRNTLYHWRKERPPRVQVQAEFAMYQLKKIAAATERGLLPLQASIMPTSRMAALHSIIKII